MRVYGASDDLVEFEGVVAALDPIAGEEQRPDSPGDFSVMGPDDTAEFSDPNGYMEFEVECGGVTMMVGAHYTRFGTWAIWLWQAAEGDAFAVPAVLEPSPDIPFSMVLDVDTPVRPKVTRVR